MKLNLNCKDIKDSKWLRSVLRKELNKFERSVGHVGASNYRVWLTRDAIYPRQISYECGIETSVDGSLYYAKKSSQNFTEAIASSRQALEKQVAKHRLKLSS